MKKLIQIIALIFLLGLPVEYLQAQDSTEVILAKDTISKKNNFWRSIYHYFADANKKNNKKFDVSIIGGPHYSSDTKVGLGLVAAGLYSINRKDSLTPISNISLFGDITTTGFYLIGVRGNNIFRNANWRIDYNLYFYSFPGAFWGLGYTAGDSDANASKYLRSQASTRFDFLFRIAPKLYVGPSAGFDFTQGKKMKRPELIAGLDSSYTDISYGVELTYDSRDFIPNAYKGFYLKLQQRNYINFNGKPFYKTLLTADYYQQAWKGAVFAFDLYSEISYGNVPWTMMANIGGSNRMRGYYEGRYRDNNMVTFQVEYRQKIYNRHGVAVWGGFGNAWGKDKFLLKHTLPNWGVGYRWEFKKRVNVRLDYGFGKSGQNSFLFSINEAF